MFDFIKNDEIDSIGIADPITRMATMPDPNERISDAGNSLLLRSLKSMPFALRLR
jgi:hypothetical protein